MADWLAGPGQSSCGLPCAQLAVIRLLVLEGREGVVGEMVAEDGGWERGCTALLELRRLGEKKKERERGSALVLFCDECESKHRDDKECEHAPTLYP